MAEDYQILETWNLSFGLMASIKFAGKTFPKMGSEIFYNDKKYKIVGVIAHATPLEANIRIYEGMKEGIYDCRLEPLE